MRVAFVYPNSRRELAAAVARGEAPDSVLLGQNHLAALGIDAFIHEPRLRLPGPRRLTWNLRELTIPWELRDTDAVFTPLANWLPLAARPRPRVRTIVVNYGLCMIYERSSRARRRLLAASLRSAAAVVSLGESQRRLLVEQTGIDPERTHTALLGIDERYFAPRPAPADGDPYVLTVGKDLSRDFATFVEAVGRLGVRAELAVYPRNLEGIELPPNARARVVDAAELRELYAGAACVVIPQRRPEYPYGSEGGGLTSLLESMAMAKPTIVSDRPILHDYVDGGTAVLVPPEDPDALADAIRRTLDDPGDLGPRARARVEQSLTTRRLAERLAPIIRACASPSTSPRSG